MAAIYRSVQMSFWTDSKVVRTFKYDDKYMFLYLMTNPHTNLAGCYEICKEQIEWETGLSKDKVESLLIRMQDTFDVIRYNEESEEILLLNWSKYNWTNSPKYRKLLLQEIEGVKDDGFREYLIDRFNGMDTVSIPNGYRIDRVSEKKEKDTRIEEIKEIVDYMNLKCETNYKASTKATQEIIRGRLNDGFTVEDFKIVIDNKVRDWKGNPRMVEFLRPQTLFAPTKFEGYLNEQTADSPWDSIQ